MLMRCAMIQRFSCQLRAGAARRLWTRSAICLRGPILSRLLDLLSSEANLQVLSQRSKEVDTFLVVLCLTAETLRASASLSCGLYSLAMLAQPDRMTRPSLMPRGAFVACLGVVKGGRSRDPYTSEHKSHSGSPLVLISKAGRPPFTANTNPNAIIARTKATILKTFQP